MNRGLNGRKAWILVCGSGCYCILFAIAPEATAVDDTVTLQKCS